MASLNVVRRSQTQVPQGLRFQFDYWLLLAVGGLVVIGMLIVYSTTFDYGILIQDDATYYIRRQFMALALGVLAGVVFLQFDYHVLRYFSVPFLAVTLLGLIIVLFFSEEILGAQRGVYEGSYQPSEVAKLATILYIAHWLHTKGDRIKMLTYGLLPFSVITGVVCALIVQQPDLSTAGLVAFVSFTLFFVAGADWRQFGLAGLIGGAVFLSLILTLPHAAARVDAYTIALRDPTQSSWQVQQALIALGRGGFTGVGLGESVQKFGPLPFSHTDGAFAILGEELGLLGSLAVMGLLGMMTWRGLRIASKARDSYGALLAIGITCWLAYQSLMNVAVITAVIPFTGIPLPFISYGGSSLAISLMGVSILLNISRDQGVNHRTTPDPTDRQLETDEVTRVRWRHGRRNLSGARRR